MLELLRDAALPRAVGIACMMHWNAAKAHNKAMVCGALSVSPKPMLNIGCNNICLNDLLCIEVPPWYVDVLNAENENWASNVSAILDHYGLAVLHDLVEDALCD